MQEAANIPSDTLDIAVDKSLGFVWYTIPTEMKLKAGEERYSWYPIFRYTMERLCRTD